jgi:hypothetical protein
MAKATATTVKTGIDGRGLLRDKQSKALHCDRLSRGRKKCSGKLLVTGRLYNTDYAGHFSAPMERFTSALMAGLSPCTAVNNEGVCSTENEWKTQNLISGKDKGAIQSCAARSKLP